MNNNLNKSLNRIIDDKISFKSINVGDELNKHLHVKENINPNLIELWIEEFLTQAEITNVKSTGMHNKADKPLARYQLDRNTLTGMRVSKENIDRI